MPMCAMRTLPVPSGRGGLSFMQGLALRCENDEPNLTSGAIAWNPAFEWRKDVQFSGGNGRDVRGRDRELQGAGGGGFLGGLVRPMSHDRADSRSACDRVQREGEGGEGGRGYQSADGNALQRSVHSEHSVLQGREARGHGRRGSAEGAPRAEVRRACVGRDGGKRHRWRMTNTDDRIQKQPRGATNWLPVGFP